METYLVIAVLRALCTHRSEVDSCHTRRHQNHQLRRGRLPSFLLLAASSSSNSPLPNMYPLPGLSLDAILIPSFKIPP